MTGKQALIVAVLLFAFGCSEKKDAVSPSVSPKVKTAPSAAPKEEHVSGNETPTQKPSSPQPGHISGNSQDTASPDPHISGN